MSQFIIFQEKIESSVAAYKPKIAKIVAMGKNRANRCT